VVSSSLSPAWSDVKVAICPKRSRSSDLVIPKGRRPINSSVVPSGRRWRDHDIHPARFSRTAICDWIDNGTMESAVNADVVALFFGGDGFTPCTDPYSHLSPAALDDLTIADMEVAINMLLAGTVQHVLVISPVPGHPSTTIPPTTWPPNSNDGQELSQSRVRTSTPESERLPTGAVPTTMPCTRSRSRVVSAGARP